MGRFNSGGFETIAQQHKSEDIFERGQRRLPLPVTEDRELFQELRRYWRIIERWPTDQLERAIPRWELRRKETTKDRTEGEDDRFYFLLIAAKGEIQGRDLGWFKHPELTSGQLQG